ncbi:MAG: ABC transporter ATP-binding protein [Bacillota bacterium]
MAAKNRYFEDEEIESIDTGNFKRLIKFLIPYKYHIMFSVFLMVIATTAGLMGPYLTKVAIDTYIEDKNVRGLLGITFLYFILLLVSAVTRRYIILIMHKTGQKIIKDLRKTLFKHIQKLSFSFFDSRPAGKIIVRVMNNVNSLQNLLQNGVINIFENTFTLFMILFIMTRLHFKLTLISLSVFPLLVLAIFFLKKKIGIRWRNYQRKNSNMNAYLHESITGMDITQAYVREEKNSSIFKELLETCRSNWMSAVMLSHSVFPVVMVITTLSVILVYWYGMGYLNAGLVTLGTLVAFLQYIWRLWQPIINMSNFYNQILIANSALERIFGIIDTEPDIKDVTGAYDLPLIKGKVDFINLSFGYDEDETVLKNFNLSVNSGETIALVGETGAGKSTIINLITRFYDIDQGKLLIDGNDIRKVTLSSLRKQIGVMMQDNFIFSGTIKENIRYGRLNASDEEIIEAAKAVYIHDFIQSLEKGYETQLNERGSQLSVGQRQLIAFARTILSNPGILILDEATSSIDTQTEIYVQKATEAVLKDRTSFVIAHRLSTIRNADRIIVLDQGRIIEQGNHEKLLKKKGAYFELYRSQYERVV